MKQKNAHLMTSWFRQNHSAIKLQMALAACLASHASAADLYWDANGDTAGAGTTPTGTWGVDTFWNSTEAGDTTAPGAWVNGDTAIFSAGTDAVDPFTISTSGVISVAGLVFQEGTPTIAGTGSLSFGTGPIQLSGGGNGTVAANVSGGALDKNGTGAVTLSGSTTVTGDLNVNAGTLTIAGPLTVSANLRFNWNNSGGTQTLAIQTGADITTNRLVMADLYYVNDTINQSGGTLNVNGSNDSNGTSASFLMGHWGYGSSSIYNLSGGTLNSPNTRLSLGWDREDVRLNQSGGTANLRGINIDNGRGNSASYNLTGGRLNIGVGGINNQSNKTINAGNATIGASANWTSTKAINLTDTVTFTTLDSVDNTTPRTIILANGATGTGGIIKNGAGTLSLGTNTGGSNYSGDTVVNAGSFYAGSQLSSKLIANSGTVIGAGSAFSPGASQLNNMDANGTTMNFRVGGASSDSLNVLDLNVVSASKISLSPAGPLFVNADFTVIKYQSLNGLGFAGLSAAALPNPHYAASLTHDADIKEIKLVVTAADSITWKGDVSSAWDINSTQNWTLDSDTSPTKYYNDDVITFDDNATTGNVVLSANVQPASVLFFNNTLNYVLSGSGQITGALGVTKSGAGSLTFESNQGYLGVTQITGGSLIVKGTLANTSVTNSASLIYDISNNQSVNYPITGSGSLIKRGTGTLTIPNNKNFSGGVTIEAGTMFVSAGGWYVNPFGATNAVTVEDTGVLSTSSAHCLGVDQNNFHVKGTLNLGAENYISNLTMTGGVVNGPGALRTWGGTMTFLASADSSVIAAPLQLVGSATLNVADGTADDDLIVSGAITNDNNLTKSGPGTLKLTGANTFNGDTTVNEGLLKVSGNSLANSKKLIINAGKVDPSGSNETVDTLYFGSEQQVAGTWGATGSGADHINDTYFTGSGVVTVVTGLPDPYVGWASSSGATGGKAADTDGDGVNNLMEFATNSNPTNGASGAKVYPKIHSLGGQDVLTLTVAARTGATFANGAVDAVKQEASIDLVKYTIEASQNLTAWNVVDVDQLGATDAAAVQAAITPALPALDTGWSWFTFRTNGSTSTDSKNFIRLNVTEVTP